VLLTSPFDVRVVDLVCEVQLPNQSYALEYDCPARCKALQEVPLVNTTDRCAELPLLPSTPVYCQASVMHSCTHALMQQVLRTPCHVPPALQACSARLTSHPLLHPLG
jgi:hypothetical protein